MKYTDVNIDASGLILAEDLYDRDDVLIAPMNTLLTPKVISSISKLGIKIILTKESDEIIPITEKEKESITRYIIDKISNNSFHGRKIYNPVIPIVTSVFIKLIIDNYAMYLLKELKNLDTYTLNHSINVAMLSGLIAKWNNHSEEEIRQVITAGFFHQIGKIHLDKNLINNQDKLGYAEIAAIKKHIILGEHYLTKVSLIDEDIKEIIMHSCELLDGSGYPHKLKKDQINPLSQIVCVANIYDAAITERPFKEAKTSFEICSELFNMSMDKLSPEVTTPLINHIEAAYHGLKVKLSNGKIGEIIFTNKYNSKKPIVKISETEYIDISAKDNDVVIIGMVS